MSLTLLRVLIDLNSRTPGELGDDQLKSKLGKKSCPDGVDVEWEGGESPFLCGCETTCPSPVEDETRERKWNKNGRITLL